MRRDRLAGIPSKRGGIECVEERCRDYAGHAEDLAQVARVDQATEVPAGAYTGVLVTEEWNPLEP